VAPIKWAACHGSAGPSGFQCATIQVPRDPMHPSAGGTIGMALDRHQATKSKIGSLLVNPGGPGGSGIDFLPQIVGIFSPSLLQHFDIIGFDPPGVARTSPINCLPADQFAAYLEYNPVPTTPAQLNGYLAEDRTFAAACQRQSGAELPYVSTADAAMDMDVIRADAGDPKLTYFGFSYGTFLGATYANLFPTRVRAMVLDGAEDPSLTPIAGLAAQSAAFDGDLKDALDHCAQDANCAWTPQGDPIAAYEQLEARVAAHSVAVPGSRRTANLSVMLYGTALTLYDTSNWTQLYSALAGLEKGDGADMLQLFDDYTGRSPQGTYTNELEANVSVNCLDAPAPSVAAIQAAAAAAKAAAPVFGIPDLYSELQCSVWPVPATGHTGAIRATGSPAIVVVGTTGDPATPYAEAQALAAQLSHGILLTRVGDGHTAYPFSLCIRQYVDSYITDLTDPPTNIHCPSNS
jgi:pimeloyl-ACP methyl ester carboxylesterase